GVLDNRDTFTSLAFRQPGDLIYLIGESKNDIASSQYLYSWHKIRQSPAPFFDLDKEFDVQQVVKNLILENLIDSAHDVSGGVRCITRRTTAMPRPLGFDMSTDRSVRKVAFRFWESQSRIVVSVNSELQEQCLEFMANFEVEYSLLGTVSDGELIIDG